MTKIAAGKVDAFVSNPDRTCLAALIYGPDTGLVSERADRLTKAIVSDPKDPFLVTDISSAKIKEDPALVSDELHAISFAPGRKLVRVRDAIAGISKPIESTLTSSAPTLAEDAFLLVTGGDMPPSSALRKLFEISKNAVALPCYQDDERSLHAILNQSMREYKLQCDPAVLHYLSDFCRGDRLVARSEMEKLSLYMGNERRVSLEDVEVAIRETTESTLDDVAHAIADGNQKELEHHLQKAFQQGVVPIALLRSVQRYFSRIQQVAGDIAEGIPQDKALQSLRPPVFFKYAAVFKRHLSRWTGGNQQKLWQVLQILYDAELACKTTGSNDILMCNRSLMKITSLVPRRR